MMIAASAPGVLIVEDELIVATDLRESLSEMGYDPFAIAASAEEAFACALARQPDIVLMDIRIKGPDDGIRTAAMLKQKYPLSVIFLTAHADEAMVDRAKRTGPDGYLVKPVKTVELRSMIELALFKRELELEKDRRRATEHRLYKIAENIPVAIAYHDRHGKVQFANRVFQELVPYREDPTGVSAMSFLGEDIYRQSYRARQAALLGEPAHVLLEFSHGEDALKFEVNFLPDHDSAGTVVGVYAIGHDVTERERLSAALRSAYEELETILNAVPASITSWDADLHNRFANSTARTQFGGEARLLGGSHMREVMGEREFRQVEPLVDRALAGEQTFVERAIEEDGGNVRYVNSYFVPEVAKRGVVGLYALAFDITELRRSHEQIRQLVRRLETVREEERRAVAVILHDGIAQDLFAMKLGIDHLASLSSRRVAMSRLCAELQVAVVKCMDDTRAIANDLRPVALDNHSVGAVIAQHARYFGARSNLNIQVNESGDLGVLGESVRLLLFRAAQEALTNVARHANATTVNVSLRGESGAITLCVSDDGVGVDPGALKKAQSLGILGLKERVEALGGQLTLSPNTPTGTCLTLELPPGS